jgi:hypothetical protein
MAQQGEFRPRDPEVAGRKRASTDVTRDKTFLVYLTHTTQKNPTSLFATRQPCDRKRLPVCGTAG